MTSAIQEKHLDATRRSNQQLTVVTFDTGWQKSGQFRVGNLGIHFQGSCERAKPASQHNRQLRAK
jgi:hypothetical protein